LSSGFDTALKSEFLGFSLEEKIYLSGGTEAGLMLRQYQSLSNRDTIRWGTWRVLPSVTSQWVTLRS